MISRRILNFLIATTVTAVITAYAANSPRWHAKDNALYIAQQLSPLRSDESLDAFGTAMDSHVHSFATTLEKNGWTIVDRDALTEAMKQVLRTTEIFHDFEQVRFQTYLEYLSPRQLAEIADFFKTDAGQWLVDNSRENGVARNMAPTDTNDAPSEFTTQIAQFLQSDPFRAADALQADLDAKLKHYDDTYWGENAKYEQARKILGLMLREDLMYHSDPSVMAAAAKNAADYDQRKAEKAQAAE